MKIEMNAGTVFMAEELTRQRALEHAASIVTAFNGAAEYARVLRSDPKLRSYAEERAKLYDAAREQVENVFTALHDALQKLSAAQHGSDDAPQWLVAIYEDDAEEHRLEIRDGKASFGMTGKVLRTFIQDATGKRQPLTGRPFDVQIGDVARLMSEGMRIERPISFTWSVVTSQSRSPGEETIDYSVAHAIEDGTGVSACKSITLGGNAHLEARDAGEGDAHCTACLEAVPRECLPRIGNELPEPPPNLPPGVVPIQKRDRR